MRQVASPPETAAEDDRFVNTPEAARILCLSEDTLVTCRNRKKEGGPPFYRFSTNKVVYLYSDLLAWGRGYRVQIGVKIAPPKAGQAPRPWES